MNIFRYDGSFEGLLSVVFDAYANRLFPQMLTGGGRAAATLCVAREVATGPEKSERVFAALRKRLSVAGIQRIMFGWLSEEEGSDMLLFRFIRKVLDSGRGIEADFSDPDVLALSKLARKVSCERHRMLGFVRFQRTSEDVYFAAIEPRHNILPLLLTHFKLRFADQRWLIYDVGRHYGYYYDGAGVHAAQVEPGLDSLLRERGGKLGAELISGDESFFQELWRGYFRSGSIKERANPKLQLNFMPKRYWKYMTELHGHDRLP